MYIICMPTIVTYGSFKISIIPGDHKPAHVHCVGPDVWVKIEIRTGKVIRNKGVGSQDVRKLQDEIEKYKDVLLKEWRRYCGEG